MDLKGKDAYTGNFPDVQSIWRGDEAKIVRKTGTKEVTLTSINPQLN